MIRFNKCAFTVYLNVRDYIIIISYDKVKKITMFMCGTCNDP